MNVEELMLGDWVYGYDGEWKPVCVKQIMGFHPSIVAVHTYGYQPDQIKPIPITPEILEKNGFAKEKEDELGITYYFLERPYTTQITLYKEPIQDVSILFKAWGRAPSSAGGVNDIHLCSVKYVHEMQHALRLCGIEKEIII